MFIYSNGSSNPYVVEGRHNLIPTCMVCGKGSVIELDGDQYYGYFIMGNKIQDAFNNLDVNQRDHILTGVHPDCSDEFYFLGVEDEEVEIMSQMEINDILRSDDR